jgi:hypothetical protein
MRKWEYNFLDSIDIRKGLSLRGPNREELEKYLNDLGSKGWEIINLDFYEHDSRGSFTGIAKREIE